MNELFSENEGKLQSLLTGLVSTCVALGLLDLAYEKHPHVKFEGWLNFYGFLAILATIAIIAIAVVARNVLERKEDFYDG